MIDDESHRNDCPVHDPQYLGNDLFHPCGRCVNQLLAIDGGLYSAKAFDIFWQCETCAHTMDALCTCKHLPDYDDFGD